MGGDQALAMVVQGIQRLHERMDQHIRDHNQIAGELSSMTQLLASLPCKECLAKLAAHDSVFQQAKGARRLLVMQWAIAGTVGGLIATVAKFLWK